MIVRAGPWLAGAAAVLVVAAGAWLLICEQVRAGHAQRMALGTRAACAGYSGLPPGWGQDARAGMQWIAAGQVEFGSERGYADERPARPVAVQGFWIDRTEVTHAQFARFVQATGYVTSAERGGGAAVFREPPADAAVSGPADWWQLSNDAHWRQPDGAGSRAQAQEPVVDVSYADALAYARWLGRDLPTEIEWEFAAKAGRDNETADAALRDAQRKPQANFWQGLFPYQDAVEDGYRGRAPVGCFAANPNGLYDMVGNVWEWTRDAYAGGAGETPFAVPRYVIKGGSYLCAANYCERARASSRQGQEADLPTSHLGFRTVLRP
ncbi:MAG TPA: SUMF1/EgtB/PvdO family nonheme iron enzyme [Fontimonas sp.]